MNNSTNTLHRLNLRFVRTLIVVWCVSVCCGVCWGEETPDTAAATHPFEGVCYAQWTKPAPDPQVAHVVTIALDTPGLRFTTTPSNGPDEPRDTWCETTREFVERVGAQIGINGNYFIYDEKDHTQLLGLAVSDGQVVSPWDNSPYQYAVNISKDNVATFVERPENGAGASDTTPQASLFNALSGNPMLLKDGDIVVSNEGDRHPRTGMGVTADNKLLLVIVDGRQASYSVGMTFHELAVLLRDHGAVDALALDGGGSATLVIADPTPRIVNVPMPTPLPLDVVLGPPGIERKNGNNLAVFVSPTMTE